MIASARQVYADRFVAGVGPGVGEQCPEVGFHRARRNDPWQVRGQGRMEETFQHLVLPARAFLKNKRISPDILVALLVFQFKGSYRRDVKKLRSRFLPD